VNLSKAAIWRGAGHRTAGATLTLEQVTLAEPGPRDVQVRIAAVAICQSDLSYIDGHWQVEGPAVFGHEAAGRVERVGADVRHLSPGDRVCVTLARACFECPNCETGHPVDCLGETPLDGRTIIRSGDGRSVLQGLRTGAFAERVLVDHSQVAAIPDDLPWASASVLSCAVLTGYGAVTRTAGLAKGASAMVIGAGGVGLNCIQAAAIAGARQIIAVDLSDDRLTAACAFGAHSTINPTSQDMVEVSHALTNGLGVDRVFVCAGSEKVIDTAVLTLALGGAVVIVGMPRTGVTCSYDPLDLASANRAILGSKFGQSVVQDDIPHLATLYQKDILKLDEMVTRRFAFEQINDALDATRRGDGLRNVILFDWAREETP
jgi:S-(hydroxymethyl)glutathione dehydrogenase/alcohol dehydrogenase